MTMIVSDKLIEQLSAARRDLERAIAEYDSRIAQSRSRSHFSSEAAAIRKELKLDVLLVELNRHLAKIECGKTSRVLLRDPETDLLH